MSSSKMRGKVRNFKLKLIKILASAIIVNIEEQAVIKPVVQEGGVGGTQYTLFFNKNVVFQGQAEYSYFSADFRL